jgi:hypothetical protein
MAKEYKIRQYQVFDKDGISSRYTGYIYAKNKKSAERKGRNMYGKKFGSVEYRGWANIFVHKNR